MARRTVRCPGFAAPLEGLRPLASRVERSVWLARDARLNRLVVLKRLPASAPRDSGEALVAALGNPVLARIYGVASADGDDWLMSEYIDGHALDESDRIWSPGAVVLTLAEVCVGLRALSEAGVAHCDLSPGNVLVDVDGKLRLIDFAQVQKLGSVARGAGTPGFAAPEVVERQRVTPVTDVWSLAALGIWMLSGETPARVSDDRGCELVVVPSWRPVDRAGVALRDCLVHTLQAAPETRPTLDALDAALAELARLYHFIDRRELRRFGQAGAELSPAVRADS